MKTRKNLVSTLILSVAMLLSINVMAQPPRHKMEQKCKSEMLHNKKDNRHRQARIGQRLGLTEEQKEKAKEIHLSSAKEVKPLTDQLRELRAHHQTLVTAEVANMKAINKSIDEMSAVKAKIAKVKAKNHQEFRSLLTEEQKLKMATMKKHKGGKKRPVMHRKAH